MVFSSVPVYLDPPNWSQHVQQQQQQAQQPPGNAFGQLSQAQAQQQQQLRQELSALRTEADATVTVPAVRTGSMVDRARLAKLPQPEQGMKCPRCDSTNTKFCYFNNYSLTQPRHFCKTCRRYWTRGGALRNVPVGGGFRRNKRSKSSGSSAKSTAAGTASSSSSTLSTGTGGGIGAITSGVTSQLPFLSSLHPLAEHQYGGASGLGLGFSGLQPIDSLEYQIGSNSSIGLENWRPLQQAQQFPFLAGLETPTQQPQQSAIYSFDINGGNGDAGLMSAAQLLPKVPGSGGLISQLASVKMEDGSQGLHLSRHYLALHGNEHFLGGGGGGGVGSSNGAANLSNFNSVPSGSIF